MSRYDTFQIYPNIPQPIPTNVKLSIFPDNPMVLMVGAPGSGKSHLLSLMLQSKKCFNQKFDFILYIGTSDIDCLKFNDSYCSRDFSIEWIRDRLKYFRDVKEDAEYLKHVKENKRSFQQSSRFKEEPDDDESTLVSTSDSVDMRDEPRRYKQFCANQNNNNKKIFVNEVLQENKPTPFFRTDYTSADYKKFEDDSENQVEGRKGKREEKEKEYYLTRELEARGVKLDNNLARFRALIICDDCVTQVKAQESVMQFRDFFNNRRHDVNNVVMNFIFTTQGYKQFPKFLRLICNGLLIFSVGSDDFTEVCKENFTSCSKAQIKMACAKHWATKFNFIYIRKDNFAVFKNFREQIG